eukprot:GILJ01004647.1.p1 GENE.GILJ01004647.1~~GILJ01004647.1.p1  ORF type:complete len:401 (+),score=39.93 GILJ01004647.1:110-1204(+)
MNHLGQAVSWGFVKDLSMAESQVVLQQIKDIHQRIFTSSPIELFYTDNCCRDASTIQQVLGSQVKIRQDLFHLEARYTAPIRTDPMVREFRTVLALAFKDSDGKIPEPARLQERVQAVIDSFLPALSAGSRDAVIQAHARQLEHIKKGCVGPDATPAEWRGTSHIERLHKPLRYIFRANIASELAEAGLEIFLHAHNVRQLWASAGRAVNLEPTLSDGIQFAPSSEPVDTAATVASDIAFGDGFFSCYDTSLWRELQMVHIRLKNGVHGATPSLQAPPSRSVRSSSDRGDAALSGRISLTLNQALQTSQQLRVHGNVTSLVVDSVVETDLPWLEGYFERRIDQFDLSSSSSFPHPSSFSFVSSS